MSDSLGQCEALVVEAFGRQCIIELPQGERRPAIQRGRKLTPTCGDVVTLTLSAQGTVIENIAPRRSLFYRASEFREKLIAANVTQVVMVVAGDPPFSTELLDRWLVVAEANGCRVLIVLNKIDLPGAARARATLHTYAEFGYPIIELCAKRDLTALLPELVGQHSVLIGQSGMGKSTILNGLLPGTQAPTAEVSRALGAGRHTTTHASLYWLDQTSWLIDSPGMQEFGLHHLSLSQIENGFREFAARLGQCRFRDCAHQREPGCALRAMVASGAASEARLQNLLRCVGEKRAAKGY